MTTAHHKARAFLKAYRLTASVTRAAAAAGIDRTMHYRWLANEQYAAAFAAAHEEAAQHLEDEAVRRATEGVIEPVTYQGQLCYPVLIDPETGQPERDDEGCFRRSAEPLVIRKYSDGLLIAVLKAFRPEKYRERVSTEVTGKGGASIQVVFVKPELAPDDPA